MLILTVVLLGGGLWLVTGWVLDEISECRRERGGRRVRRRRLARAAAVASAGWRELAHAHALLRGDVTA